MLPPNAIVHSHAATHEFASGHSGHEEPRGVDLLKASLGMQKSSGGRERHGMLKVGFLGKGKGTTLRVGLDWYFLGGC